MSKRVLGCDRPTVIALGFPNENDKKRQSLPECHAIDGHNGQA